VDFGRRKRWREGYDQRKRECDPMLHRELKH
jgi:hypothetical protein